MSVGTTNQLSAVKPTIAKATPNNNRYECPIRLGLKV